MPIIRPKNYSQFVYVLAFVPEFISGFNIAMHGKALEENKDLLRNTEVNGGEEIHELKVPVDDLAHCKLVDGVDFCKIKIRLCKLIGFSI